MCDYDCLKLNKWTCKLPIGASNQMHNSQTPLKENYQLQLWVGFATIKNFIFKTNRCYFENRCKEINFKCAMTYNSNHRTETKVSFIVNITILGLCISWRYHICNSIFRECKIWLHFGIVRKLEI